jgi:hypothetical protein
MLSDKGKAGELARTGFNFLDGHRLSSLYRGANPTTENFLVQILRESARGLALSHGAKRQLASFSASVTTRQTAATPQKPRLDRLAETDIVCDQKIDARES